MNALQLTKRCTGPCSKELPATEEYFNRHPTGKYGLQPRCKDCKREENAVFRRANSDRAQASVLAWKSRNPEKVRSYARKYINSNKGKQTSVKNWLSTKYGLTEEQYQEMFDRQNGRCAICGRVENESKRLHVDHVHGSNELRGLLCGKCNRGIGMFNDDPELFDRAREYLTSFEKNPSKIVLKTSDPNYQKPKVTKELLEQLSAFNLTKKQMADYCGCSVATVKRRLGIV